MTKFKVDNLVRVKPMKEIAPRYWNAIGPIVAVTPNIHHPYGVPIKGVVRCFFEDEMEKI
ncbi:unnamed protein product [marine sediment metagenome]|uniref:Uncharacterized protein n=1 Tax=marine sediment metagenome TaxID=412755 RepID=X1J935_9ZZZZ